MAEKTASHYFEKARAAGQIVVSDAPKFDLETYIANYKGKTRVYRLHHIGTTSSYLCLEALRAGAKEAKQYHDLRLYEKVIGALREIHPDDHDAQPDQFWMEQMQKEVKAETDRLEQELRGYKNNLIKESIRMGYDDLGRHYHQIGELGNAFKSYVREREFCQMTAHVILMSFRLVHVSIDQRDWLRVSSNAQKLRNMVQKPGDQDRFPGKISAALGLAELGLGNYRDAALSFINTSPHMLQARLDDPADEAAYNEIITPNDIAVYGGLCALASMDRNELQLLVLNNSGFRNYLELEPHLRRAITFFVSSKYSQCLAILESYRTDYILDMYLYSHISDIYTRILNKAIVQYFVPFSCSPLGSIAAAFNADEATIEPILKEMIANGSLHARIDLEHHTLVANTPDQRADVYEEAHNSVVEYKNTAHMRLLRMGIIHAGLEVPFSRGQQGMLNMSGLAEQ